MDSSLIIPPQNGDGLEEDVHLQSRIDDLEAQLARLRSRQHQKQQPPSHPHPHHSDSNSVSNSRSQLLSQVSTGYAIPSPIPTFSPPTHFLLLLSDSALPLGSFAFSSGLESFLAHTTRTPTPPPQLFTSSFLPLSIASYASTALPFVLAAHRSPASLALLDDALDAATICTVARRSSVAQGRALLSIWERSLSPPGPSSTTTTTTTTPDPSSPSSALLGFSAALRSAQASNSTSSTTTTQADHALPPAVSAHLPPLFGAVARAAGLDAQQGAFVFMLNHVKALVSAAVRRGMFGPYQAQKILASGQVRDAVEAVVRREWDTPFEQAGQSVPVMDLWVGRHEMLYSRIFNS